MFKKAIAAVAIFSVIGYLVYLEIDKAGSDSQQPRNRTVPVATTAVIMDEFVDQVEALGTARARESIDLTAGTTDKIADINFTDGMSVQKGDVLATLLNDEEEANLKVAEANFREQKRELERVRGLVKTRALPAARLDTQTSLYERAVAERSVALARLEDRKIIAPFDGILGLRQVSEGALVTPGTVIATLDDLSLIKLDFTIPETFLASLKVGQEIQARTDAYGERLFTGKVINIDSRINPISRAVTVRAEIVNDDRTLRPGMLMRVDLIKNRSRSLMIPEEAVLSFGTRKFVFVVDENMKASRQEIKIGRRTPGNVEILSGLALGENVVTEGTLKVRHGANVKLNNQINMQADVKTGGDAS